MDTGLTNVASRLICTRLASTRMKNHYNAFISRKTEIVNALYSFLERRADPIAPMVLVLDPVPVACPGTKPWEQRSAVVGGKFICPPQLAKWLAKMRFLAASRDNRVDELFL